MRVTWTTRWAISGYGDAVDVGVPVESRPGERRTAAIPQTVTELVGAGLRVRVQSGLGQHSHLTDDAYRAAGAEVVDHDPSPETDAVLAVQPLDVDRAARLREGTVLIGFLPPAVNLDLVGVLRDRGVTAFSLDLVPRLTRAQGIDALSSQAMVSGYRAALIAATRLPRFFPMLTTAAGTVPPARVLVIGAGVAGLQAIATARRLGAVVSGYDVRSAAAEEVRSLGGRFLDLDLEAQQGVGGYATEQTEDFRDRQRRLLGEHVAASDVVITTAAVPGKPAPVLVTQAMVESMSAGAVVIDLAAESGGNCELSVAGKEVWHRGVLVWGARNLPSDMPAHASRLYARNVANLLLLMTSDGQVRPDFADEVVAACCVTHGGEIRHEPTRRLMEEAAR